MKFPMKILFTVYILIFMGWFNAKSQPFSSQAGWENYFSNRVNDLDPIEGIWSLSSVYKIYDQSNSLIKSDILEHCMTLAVYGNGNEYFTYSVGTSEPAEIRFLKTAASDGYIIETFDDMSFTSSIKTTAIVTNDILISYSYRDKNQNNSLNLPVGNYIIFNNELN